MIKHSIDSIEKYFLDGVFGYPIHFYLFLLCFFPRIISLLIVGNIFNQFEAHQHYILLYEKYSYIILFLYMIIYMICYFNRYRRIDVGKPQIIAFSYWLFVIISTILNRGNSLKYDYYTKLSLFELMMTSVFMLNCASYLSDCQFKKLFIICGKGFLYINAILNMLSLISVVTFPSGGTVKLFGMIIELPKVIIDSDAWRIFRYRYAGFYRNTASLAIHCYFALLTAIILFNRKHISKVIFVLNLLSNTFLILFSGNRNGMLMLLIFLVIYAAQILQKTKKIKPLKSYLSVLLLLVLLLAVFMLLKADSVFRIVNIVLSDPFTAIDNFSSARLRIMYSVFDMVKKSPIIGVGWKVSIPIKGSKVVFESAHNVILNIILWSGIIGFCLFIMFLLISNRYFKHHKEMIINNQWLFSVIICVFIQCMFDQGILGDARHVNTYMFWLILGYFLKPTDYDKKQEANINRC